MRWKYESEYGELDITINLSKPEKDPKAIAAAKNAPQTAYPKCQLCMENQGYAGRTNHPARQNHRILPITNILFSSYSGTDFVCLVVVVVVVVVVEVSFDIEVGVLSLNNIEAEFNVDSIVQIKILFKLAKLERLTAIAFKILTTDLYRRLNEDNDIVRRKI